MYKKSIVAISTLAMLSTTLNAEQELNNIIVTAKSNKSINDLSGSITVITQEDIKKYNATNLRDALTKIAGISTLPSGSEFGGQGISIRGSQSDHVLILVDGKNITNTDSNILLSDFQYSWVPMNLIERIEIIKGSMSSIYGSEAIGGVINIITKKSDEKLYGEIDMKLGSSSDDGGNTKEVSFNIGGKVTDNLSLILSAEKKDIDVITRDSKTYSQGKEYTNGMIKLSYDIDDTQNISASYSAGVEDRDVMDNTRYYEIDRENYDLSYTKQFKDVAVKLDYYLVSSDNYSVSRESEHQLENETIKGEISIESINNNYIVLGAESKKEKYEHVFDDPNSNDEFSDSSTTKSFFMQDEIEIGKNLIFTLGSRYDDHEVFGGEWSPKAGLVYKLSDKHRLKLNYGEGFIAPGLKENSENYLITLSYPGISFDFRGNPDLEPETSVNYDIGYEYYSNETTVKVNLFKNDIKNLIQFAQIDGTFDYTYKNVEDVSIKGVELEVGFEINENHNLLFNYTYLNAKNKNNDEELTFRSNNKVNLILNSSLPYNISSTLSATYTGSQYDNTEKLDSYITTNIQLSKSLSNSITVRTGIDNIENDRLDSDNSSTPGRVYYLGLNYKF